MVAGSREWSGGSKRAVYTRWQNSDSIRTRRYHYTEWRNDGGDVVARMLYDHLADPAELTNVAEIPQYALVAAELSQALAGHIGSLE